jgi:hypothetical protein
MAANQKIYAGAPAKETLKAAETDINAIMDKAGIRKK